MKEVSILIEKLVCRPTRQQPNPGTAFSATVTRTDAGRCSGVILFPERGAFVFDGAVSEMKRLLAVHSRTLLSDSRMHVYPGC